MIKIGMDRRCISCKFVDMGDIREPSNPCCTLHFDNNGFWKTVIPKKDFCSWFKPKKDNKS